MRRRLAWSWGPLQDGSGERGAAPVLRTSIPRTEMMVTRTWFCPEDGSSVGLEDLVSQTTGPGDLFRTGPTGLEDLSCWSAGRTIRETRSAGRHAIYRRGGLHCHRSVVSQQQREGSSVPRLRAERERRVQPAAHPWEQAGLGSTLVGWCARLPFSQRDQANHGDEIGPRTTCKLS